MEKFGVSIDEQKRGLLVQESALQNRIANLITSGEKTASDEIAKLNLELQEVRVKIYELDNVKTEKH